MLCVLIVYFFYFILFIILCVCGRGGGDVVTKRKIRILIWIQKIHDFFRGPISMYFK